MFECLCSHLVTSINTSETQRHRRRKRRNKYNKNLYPPDYYQQKFPPLVHLPIVQPVCQTPLSDIAKLISSSSDVLYESCNQQCESHIKVPSWNVNGWNEVNFILREGILLNYKFDIWLIIETDLKK